MYGPTAATRPRVPGAGWGEGGPLARLSCKREKREAFPMLNMLKGRGGGLDSFILYFCVDKNDLISKDFPILSSTRPENHFSMSLHAEHLTRLH